MTFNRIAFGVSALINSATLAYALSQAASDIEYVVICATGAAALLVLGLLAHPDNH